MTLGIILPGRSCSGRLAQDETVGKRAWDVRGMISKQVLQKAMLRLRPECGEEPDIRSKTSGGGGDINGTRRPAWKAYPDSNSR